MNQVTNPTNAESTGGRADDPASFGFSLHRIEIRELQLAGIVVYQRPRISLHYQKTGAGWVLRGEEFGGANERLGHYVGFVPINKPFLSEDNIQTVLPNSIHRVVFAKTMVRYEMYRCASTYALLISLHWLDPEDSVERPAHKSRTLFRDRFGKLDEKLWTPAAASFRGSLAPTFKYLSGDKRFVPDYLADGVFRITEAVCCVRCRCKHAHFYDATPLDVSQKLTVVEPACASVVEMLPVSAAPALLPVPVTATEGATIAPRQKKKKRKKHPAKQPVQATPSVSDAPQVRAAAAGSTSPV